MPQARWLGRRNACAGSVQALNDKQQLQSMLGKIGALSEIAVRRAPWQAAGKTRIPELTCDNCSFGLNRPSNRCSRLRGVG